MSDFLQDTHVTRRQWTIWIRWVSTVERSAVPRWWRVLRAPYTCHPACRMGPCDAPPPVAGVSNRPAHPDRRIVGVSLSHNSRLPSPPVCHAVLGVSPPTRSWTFSQPVRILRLRRRLCRPTAASCVGWPPDRRGAMLARLGRAAISPDRLAVPASERAWGRGGGADCRWVCGRLIAGPHT